MPRTGYTYSRPNNSFTNPVANTAISTTAADEYFDDLDAALTASAIRGELDSTGTFGLSGVLTPSQITSNQNDYAPTGHATKTVLRLSSDASRDITGLAGGADGRIVIVHNVGAQNIVLKDESVSSIAANRFALAADITLSADAVGILQYDGTSGRWRAVSGGGGGGGGGGDVTAASAFGADNRLVRSDGTGKGVQASGITIDDSDNVTGAASIVVNNDGLKTKDSDASHNLIISTDSNLTADRTLNLNTGDASRALTISGDHTLPGGTSVVTAGNQNLTGGFTAGSYAAGTKSSGTFTPDPLLGNVQDYTNNGAHTLAPFTSYGTLQLDQTNGASAGTITRSGWTHVTGDTLTTTNGKKFRHYCSVGVAGSHIHTVAFP